MGRITGRWSPDLITIDGQCLDPVSATMNKNSLDFHECDIYNPANDWYGVVNE